MVYEVGIEGAKLLHDRIRRFERHISDMENLISQGVMFGSVKREQERTLGYALREFYKLQKSFEKFTRNVQVLLQD